MAVFFVVYVVLVFGFVIWYGSRMKKKKRNLAEQGYKQILRQLWMKDDAVFFVAPYSLKPCATPIEVTEVNEILRNANLVQLEVRYRINGSVSSVRLSGTKDMLLTAMDTLGYGG